MKPEKSLACSAITPDIASLCKQIAQWRKTRRRGERMPERLWVLARDLAGRHTAGRIARVARIDYYALKKRVDGSVAPPAEKQERQPVFLEVPVSVGDHPVECVIEMEHPRGGRMRIHSTGVLIPDLAALSRSFWNRES